MTSSRPYFIRAIYEWLNDNALTPYVMVDAGFPNTTVPEKYIKDGKIVLNISQSAVADLTLGNSEVEFNARFDGVIHHIFIPVMAIEAIYSFENGRGMVFHEEDTDGDPVDGGDGGDGDQKKGPPNLRVIK